MAAPSPLVDIAADVLALSKAMWKCGVALSKLSLDAASGDSAIANLTEDVKLLGNECDLLYADLDDVPSKVHEVDEKIWTCLQIQAEEINRTVHELEVLINSIRENRFPHRTISVEDRDSTVGQRIEVCRHTDNLRITNLLISIVVAYLVPGRVDGGFSRDLERLLEMLKKLQRSSETSQLSDISRAETLLFQAANDIVVKGTAMRNASLVAEQVAAGQVATTSTFRVADWLTTLEAMRRDQQTATLAEAKEDESDNELDVDMAKSALATGAKAFEAQDWQESESLLQEALQVLRQVPRRQRAFCDLFSLHFELAICAYYTQDPVAAAEALASLVQQTPSSNEQQEQIYAARHKLSCLFLRKSELDSARAQCEKALQGRRRLLGKDNDASLESLALMAHIYVLLNNRARAKSCLAMIPDGRRTEMLRSVELSLDGAVEHLEFSSLLTRPTSESLNPNEKTESRHSSSTLSLTPEISSHGFAPGKSPASSVRQAHRRFVSKDRSLEDLRSILSSTEERSESFATVQESTHEDNHADSKGLSVSALSLGDVSDSATISPGRSFSRKDILEKIGCQPRDQIEEAVCKGDHSVLAGLLSTKKSFWRSKLRKKVRPERVTALHFAALFGEVDMAKRLLGAGYNVNDVPYGYSTTLTCLKFAIGARQVEMVEFLISNGARPAERETWSTLAGQLMNRSWLMKTMSDAEREFVPNRIIAIMGILLRRGWDINEPIDPSGSTVLHQAVGFWTGAYRWDLNLRTEVTLFLCERGADVSQANKEGKTPYDLASASGHQDLLLLLEKGPNHEPSYGGIPNPVELPSDAYTTMKAEGSPYQHWNGDLRTLKQ